MFGDSRVSRRAFLTTSGLAAAALGVGGCAKGENKVASSGGGGGHGISTAAWDDSVGDVLKGPVADAFTEKTQIKVTPQASVPFSDYQTRFRTLLAGGSPPDVMRLNDDFMPEISEKKLGVELKRYFDKSGINLDDFFPIFEWSKLPTGQRGLVVASQVRLLYYNKTMFQKEGIPLPPTTWTPDGWKWDDFLDAAKGLTKGTEQYGAAIIQDTGYEEIWSRNNGGPGTYSEDGLKLTLADELGCAALQWCVDLTLKHKVQPRWGDLKPDQAVERMFVAGKLGMNLSTSSNIAYYNDNVKDFEWDVCAIPAKVNQYQQGSIVLYIIPEKAKNKDQAWEYLNFAIGEEGGTFVAEAGVSVPVNRAAAKSLKSPGKYPEHMNIVVEGSDQSKIVNYTKAGSQAVALYRPQLERAYTGEVSVKKALEGIRGQVEKVLQG